jgi:uncharacterized membrane protein
MNTWPNPLLRTSWLRPKYLLFGFIALMLAYVLPHDESFLVHPNDHYEPFKWWLLPHGVAGACALLLGPMQFSDRLRLRFRKLHRVLGRIYVAGVFVAAPLGFYIQYFEGRMGVPRSFSIAAAADALLWMVTTGIAMAFILKGKVQQHRQWMTRSFAVALVFLEVRVIGGVGGWENLDAHVNETIVWRSARAPGNCRQAGSGLARGQASGKLPAPASFPRSFGNRRRIPLVLCGNRLLEITTNKSASVYESFSSGRITLVLTLVPYPKCPARKSRERYPQVWGSRALSIRAFEGSRWHGEGCWSYGFCIAGKMRVGARRNVAGERSEELCPAPRRERSWDGGRWVG